jgi:hypothetical protein
MRSSKQALRARTVGLERKFGTNRGSGTTNREDLARQRVKLFFEKPIRAVMGVSGLTRTPAKAGGTAGSFAGNRHFSREISAANATM